jgi:arylsulfatase A-like enzyme
MRSSRLALLTLLALPCLPIGCARQRPVPNVLLIVVDTLRADHVGGRNGKPSLTPNLDRFAQECLVFDHAQSPRAKTTPAVATLMTGLYPHDHHVRDLTTPLGPDIPLWAEGFKLGGYRTGAIIGNYVLQDKLSGLARGFDLWIEDLPDENGVPPSHVPMRGAASITDGLLCALGLGEPSKDGAGPFKTFARPGQPWFLYAHYMDPHGAYEPPAPYREEALARVQVGANPIPTTPPAEDALHKRWVAEYNIPEAARLTDGSIDAGVLEALYGGEVSYVDAQIGRVLDGLRASGELANTLVIITADHGESLGEHDYWFEHGRYAYEATCRVPLMIRFPDVQEDAPAPGIRHGDISLADLRPTLTETCWLPRGRGANGQLSSVRGRSRASLLREDKAAGAPVFCEKVERAEKTGTVQAKAVRIGDWKFIRRYTHVRQGTGRDAERQLVILSEELYDLSTDPAEARNLVQTPGDAPMEDLVAALLEFSSADRHFAELARQLQKRREDLGREDPETLRALRALGY